MRRSLQRQSSRCFASLGFCNGVGDLTGEDRQRTYNDTRLSDIEVLIDPSEQEIIDFIKRANRNVVRASRVNNVLLVWDSYHATHQEVERLFGFSHLSPITRLEWRLGGIIDGEVFDTRSPVRMTKAEDQP